MTDPSHDLSKIRCLNEVTNLPFVLTNVCLFFFCSTELRKNKGEKLKEDTDEARIFIFKIFFGFQGVIQRCIKSDFKHDVAVQESNRQFKTCSLSVSCQMEEIQISQRLRGHERSLTRTE